MTTHDQIVRRFAEKAGLPESGSLKDNGNLIVGHHSGYGSYVIDTIYSYGSHFPLATIMPSASGDPRGWWLLNGDTYSVSTSRHQSLVRNAVKGTGLPSMIVSFSALNEAGIRHSSITPVEILPDRYTWEPRTRVEAPSDYSRTGGDSTRNWQQLPDGRWSYEAQVHHLGEAVFHAKYTQRVPRVIENGVWRYPPNIHGTAYFLSAFDENEPGFGLYFMCQLPPDAKPSTVAEAREALKPELVKFAEKAGLEVLRQGDVFAIVTDAETRNLRAPSERAAFVLGVNHQVTEVRHDKRGLTYGRGFMRHRPRESWRRPEHRTLKLGDGKTWYLLVRNTVPEGRSWSMGGNVD